MSETDRTVHATGPTVEIVRYDRVGKWYIEQTNPTWRKHVGVHEAARFAVTQGCIIERRLPGGQRFDQITDELMRGVTA